MNIYKCYLVAIFSLSMLISQSALGQEISHYSFSGEGSLSPAHAVKVKRGGLVHTRQFSALSKDDGNFDGEISDLLGQIAGTARAYETNLKSVVKLSLYLSKNDPALVAAIEKKIKATWPNDTQPAVTMIISSLPGGAVLAGDAVIACSKKGSKIERFERDAAMMPSDRDIIYVSGRAFKGDVAAAAAGTMKELFGDLDLLGSKPADVIQVKAFIDPMEESKTFEREIEASFGDGPIPPIIYVRWISGARPCEIELIAAAPDKNDSEKTVSYHTPEKDKASPVYAKIARFHGDEIIYIGGTVGGVDGPPKAQLKSLYSSLGIVAAKSGTTMRHLAKATYYVTDQDVSKALNALRPGFYDPQRPPAASKVTILGLIEKNRGLLIDMIAAPVR